MKTLEYVSKLLKIIQIIISLAGVTSICLKYYTSTTADKSSDACCGYINHNDSNCNYDQYTQYGFTKDINNICIVNDKQCTSFPMQYNDGSYYDGYYYVSKGGNFNNCTVNKTNIYNSSDTELNTFILNQQSLLNTTCTQNNIDNSINSANDQFINFLLWFIVAMPGFIVNLFLSISELCCKKVYLFSKAALSLLCCPCILCCSDCPCKSDKCGTLIVNFAYYFAKFMFYCFSSMGNDQFNSGINDESYFSIQDVSGESDKYFADCWAGYNPLIVDNSKIYDRFHTTDKVVKILIHTGYGITVAQFLLNQYMDRNKDRNEQLEMPIND